MSTLSKAVALAAPLTSRARLRYIAGDTLQQAIPIIRSLNLKGLKGTLSLVGSHSRRLEQACSATDDILESLTRVRDEDLDCDISIKLTKIGLDVDESLSTKNLTQILEHAASVGIFVYIDMEEYAYVETTLRIFDLVRQRFTPDRVGIAAQSYLRNHRAILNRLIDSGSQIRLVRGGYLEHAEVAYRKRFELDLAFAEDIRTAMRRACRPAIATHNERFIEVVKQAADEFGSGRNDFEFQFLHGVREDLAQELAAQGYAVRIYVPYGPDWHTFFLGCSRRAIVSAMKGVLVFTRSPELQRRSDHLYRKADA